MKGLELAKKYYEHFGRPMLETEFFDVSDRIAVGLAGEGSECMGYDDEISHDHDFEPGFCLWITAEDERKFGFKLERAYSKLPKVFEGFERQPLSPVGGNRHGVIVIEDFYKKFLGTSHTPETSGHWFSLPSASLLAASNGQVWQDKLGVFSETREKLRQGYPEDIRRKKLAAHILSMAQSGQYNFSRCKKREDIGGARLCLSEFTRHAISAIYLLNNKYEPFYKWAYRGMRDLPTLSDIADKLIPLDISNAHLLIEEIADDFVKEFKNQNLSDHDSLTLSAHAYKITETIKNGEIRNMHILDGI